MPRFESTGEVRQNADGSFSTVVRTFEKRETFRLPTCSTWPEAEERSKVLASVAKRMRDVGCSPTQGREALNLLAAASERSLKSATLVAEELVGGRIPIEGAPDSPTFEAVAKEWTKGDLHKRFPDHVKKKDWALDKARLEKLSAIELDGARLGDVPIDRFTLDHAERAMQKLPADAKRPATRKQYAQLVNRVLSLAVYPCRYIAANPLPKGFMPKAGKSPAYAYLYPAEDRALMAKFTVPLGYRLLYGFLAREGCRISEAMGLTWRDVDLERGVVTLDRNKTDDARAWALNPGVTRALKAWKERSTHAFVFADEDGILDIDGIAQRLRDDLMASGVDRAELHKQGENRGRFRVHDLRGTFVTLALANGKTETWVSDRTGHASSQMINRYRRAARSAQELELGELDPLDAALEWADCHSIATHVVGQDRLELSANGLRGRDADPQVGDTKEVREDTPASRPSTSPMVEPERQRSGNTGPSPDAVEAALSEALSKAAAAGQWTTVEVLSRELTARRESRATVVPLDAVRRRRDRQGS